MFVGVEDTARPAMLPQPQASPYPAIPAVAPAPMAPPVDPAQLVQMMQAYQSAFAGLPDTAFNPALTRFGLGLLQPVRPGDSPGGVFARAGTDALNYYDAKSAQDRNQMLQAGTFGQKERELQGQERQRGEQIAASEQNRGIQAANAPVALASAKNAFEQAQAAMRQIQADEAAGNRSPEFLRRKAQAEVALKEAQQRMYDAHAGAYGAMARNADTRNQKQTVNSFKGDDGSFTSVVTVNGEPHFHTYMPPRFSDVRAARAQAEKDVDKETPSSWNPFAGPAPYQGTRDQEVTRRTQEYMTPRSTIMGPGGRRVTPEEWGRMGQPPAASPGATPTPASAPQPGVPAGPTLPAPTTQGGPGFQPASPTGMPPVQPKESQQQAQAAAQNALTQKRLELRNAMKGGAPELVAGLKKEVARLEAQIKGGSPDRPVQVQPGQATPTPGAPTKLVRDATGNLVPEVKPTGTRQPEPTIPNEQRFMEAAGKKLDQARIVLERARHALESFGQRQIAKNADGYRAALANMKTAQEQVAQAQMEYEQAAPPTAAARAQPRSY